MLLCLKRNVSQTFKSSGCKKVFPKCVCHWYNLLRWMLFILCDNWKALFFIQIYCYPEVWWNHHVAVFLELSVFKDTLKAFDDFKNKQRNCMKYVFWYVKVCIFWKCVQYTIHWDKTKMLKNIPLDKIYGTKNVLYFLSRAPTFHNLTFNLRFLYELKRKFRLQNCPGFSIFDSVSFLLKFIFLFNKMHGLFDFKTS